MEHKTKSVLLVSLLLVMTVAIGLFVNYGGGITGAVVTEEIACYEDSDCDDKIEETEDICRNPGTEFSLCVNKVKE